MAKTAAILGILGLYGYGIASQQKPTVAEALKKVRVLAIPDAGRPVDRTVAEELRRDLAPQAAIREVKPGEADGPVVFRIAVAGEKIASGPAAGELRKAAGTGRDLHRSYKVPIGLGFTSVGVAASRDPCSGNRSVVGAASAAIDVSDRCSPTSGE